MKGRRTLLVVTVLALLCLCGIVGMLLAEGAWDWLFFAMAALPIAVGAARRRIGPPPATGDRPA